MLRARCGERARASAFSLSTPLSPNLQMLSNLEALSKPMFWGFFLEVSLHNRDWWNHWPLIQPPSPLSFPEIGDRTESSNPLRHKVCSAGNQPSTLGSPKVALLTEDTGITVVTGNSKSFRYSVPETGTKDQKYISYYKSWHHTYKRDHTICGLYVCLLLSSVQGSPTL